MQSNIQINLEREHARITEKIRKTVLENVGDVIAIFYVGSWAKKEMSYIVDNNNIDFLNDIDVLLITKSKVENIKYLRDIISKAVNDNYFSYEEYVKTDGIHNFYVDIRNYCVEDLKNVISRIKYYDIFAEPQPIYIVDKDITKLFPIIRLDDIPLQDGLIHLFNRMGLLIEWNPTIIKKDKRILILVLKAYTAILDALLLINKRYVVSPKDRADIFSTCYRTDFYDLWKKFPDLHDRISLMTDMKINYYKYHEKINDNTIIDIWLNARRDIIVTMIYTVNRIYKTDFELSTCPENIINVIDFLNNKNGFTINPLIKELSKKKFGFKPGSLIGLIYILIRYRYFLKFNEIYPLGKYEIIKKTINNKEPMSQLYLAALSLLSGMDYNSNNVIYDNRFVRIADKYLNNLTFHNDRNVMDKFREVFRIWELFSFEQ